MGKFTGILLATDIDGTLLGPDQRISERNRSAIDYFMENGGLFTLATGRSLAGIQAVKEMLELNAPAILNNGALLYDYEGPRIVYSEVLRPETRALAGIILERYPNIGLEILRLRDKCVINRGLAIEIHLDWVRAEGVDIQSPAEADGDWYKIILCDLPKHLRPAGEWLLAEYGGQFEICYSCGSMLEIQNKGSNKGVGLSRLAGILGLRRENVFCAGDNQNDLSMLRHFHGFAPENAVDECKAAAVSVGPDCGHDFIAYVIGEMDRSIHK